MSQQIPASTPSPVSAPVQTQSAEASFANYQPSFQPTQAVQAVPTQNAQYVVAPATAPTTSDPYSQSASPSNPWQQAMTSLESIVNRVSPSPSQTPSYPSPQTAGMDTTWNSQISQGQAPSAVAPSVAPTYSNSEYTTQNSYQGSTEVPTVSDASLEVVNHFGLEAPGILNEYAVTLEDALIQQQETTDAIGIRAGAMETILTDPEYLADYTDRFFTEVYPVDEEGNFIGDETVVDNEEIYAEDYEGAPEGYTLDEGYWGDDGYWYEYTGEAGDQEEYAPEDGNYDNSDMPGIPMTANMQGVAPTQQWEGFSETMQRSPENAWRYLSQMEPSTFQSKLLFMDQY